jgi:hypothetical protein
MKKDIQKQLYRMTFVVLVMIAMAIWQHDFVVTAINSNVFLNSTIIGTFLFGLGLVFKYQFDLYNEMTSFDALQEKYNDIQRKIRDEIDPFWRFQRCQKPATIFSPPRIMWQAYFLISDEMSRTGNLKISAGTMQTLIDGIDTKLDDQKSLATYITGLLVFLGLIGTFVGLMVTLASVGKIIGDLDLSGSGGTETIQKLMNNLKTPLQGMATGFSSSLFGLITSLALGLIVRFQNLAASSLKLGFEAWLSSVVHITDDVDGSPAATGNGAQVQDMQHLQLMYNVAKYSLTASNRTNRVLDKLISAVSDLTGEQSRQGAATLELSGHMEKNAQFQGVMSYHLGRTAKALEGHDDLALKLREIDVALNTRLDGLAGVIDRSSGNIESLTEEIIRLGEQDESRLDLEYQRMMDEIDKTIKREQGKPCQEQEPLVVNANKTRPAATPQATPTPTSAGSSDIVSEMRDRLAEVFEHKNSQDV